MNIAVVVLDTLRKDAFDQHLDWMPGIRFESGWSVSHHTLPTHGSLFTGLYPSEHGTHGASRSLDYPSNVLPESLAAAGYRTRAFSSNMYVSPPFRFDRGFDEFRGSLSVKPTLPDYHDYTDYGSKSDNQVLNYLLAFKDILRSDTKTIPSLEVAIKNHLAKMNLWHPPHSGIRDAIRWIKTIDFTDKEFLFFNFMETHAPYHHIPDTYKTEPTFVPPERGLADELTPETQTKVRTQYYDAAEFLSDQYRQLFSKLSDEMDYIITIADHGESLGEDGRWEHESGLYPELTRVPLVISGHDTVTEERDVPVNTLDVYNTIINLTDVGPSRRGRNLLEKYEAGPLLQETHWHIAPCDSLNVSSRSPYRGLITNQGEHCFDSPEGLVNPEAVDNPHERIQSLTEQLEKSAAGDNSGRDVSSHVREQLERLGYR